MHAVECLKRKPRGPFKEHIPKRYQYLSSKFLNSLSVNTYAQENEIHEKDPTGNIDVLVRKYSDTVHHRVLENLHD